MQGNSYVSPDYRASVASIRAGAGKNMRKWSYYIFILLFMGLLLVWMNEEVDSPYLTALVIICIIFYTYFRARTLINEARKQSSLKRSQGILVIIAGLVLIGVGILGGYHVIPNALWSGIMIAIAVVFLVVFVILGFKSDKPKS